MHYENSFFQKEKPDLLNQFRLNFLDLATTFIIWLTNKRVMKKTSKERRLEEYYTIGFAKGQDDAFRGIGPHCLPHTLRMSSAYMRAWEKGYREGYRRVQQKKVLD